MLADFCHCGLWIADGSWLLADDESSTAELQDRSFVIRHQPSAISHQPSAISHSSSAIKFPTSPITLRSERQWPSLEGECNSELCKYDQSD
jgi:hypothetical protein